MVKVAEFVSPEVFQEVGRLCAYYSYLEGAIAQAIWLELRVSHDQGHPDTDRLQLRDRFKNLVRLHRKSGRTALVAYLESLQQRINNLMERRHLLIHGTVIFEPQDRDRPPGIRWLMVRGSFDRKPQEVTAEMVRELIAECEALTADFNTIGRLYPTVSINVGGSP